MAAVVDVLREARQRFTVWAQEYVSIPPRMLAGETVRGECVDEIVRFLAESKVFEKNEIELIAEKRGFFGVIAFDKITEV